VHEAPQAPLLIPAGTTVPVSLTGPIFTKKARKGDAVRVVTAFPVTVGTALAIPAGTYLEGVIDKVQKQRGANPARLQMHFTRMIYSNGYEVSLNSATALANRNDSDGDVRGGAAATGAFPMSNGFLPEQSQLPPPPPLPKPSGPSMGTEVGIGLGVTAGVAVLGILFATHRGMDSEFEPGTQFDLTFQSEIALDRSRVPRTSGQ